MANTVCEVLLTEAGLKVPLSEAAAGSGAVLDFLGLVRPLENGRKISGIAYEAHLEMASHQLNEIGREVTSKFDLDAVIIHHRLGFVECGQASVWVRTATRHRGESYRANEWIMNELKKRAPIWKRPRFEEPEPALVAEPASQPHR